MSLDVEYTENMGEQWEIWNDGSRFLVSTPSVSYLRMMLYRLVFGVIFHMLFNRFNRKGEGWETAVPTKRQRLLRYVAQFIGAQIAPHSYHEDVEFV